MNIHKISPDVTVMSDSAEVPGIGFLAVNTFVVHADQPVVVDTGLSTSDKDLVSDLAEVIDPADVRWIWITHPDRDHTGGMWKLLEAAPNARIVTTFLGVGILSTEFPVPLDRVYLLNPGQSLDVGDRTLRAFRPPLFDSPATTGFIETKTGAMFSSDCFGGPMQSPDVARSADLREVGSVLDAQLLWASIDSPWVHSVDPVKYQATIDSMKALDPSAVFSTHLPPARGDLDGLWEMAAMAPANPGFIGPDQAALEQLLASFAPAAEAT